MYHIRIGIENMQFFSKHGYYDEEQIVGTPYRVDVYLTADVIEGANNDDLSGTINYEKVFAICTIIMNVSARLIESLAVQIADKVMGLSEKIAEVTVKVTKLQVPANAIQIGQTFVEVKKMR